MGRLFIQPTQAISEDIEASSLVVYPHRIDQNEEMVSAAVEWAAGSQSPVFCHEEDIDVLVGQGFGAYRFHGLSGYKEIGFQGGAVEFYPARRHRPAGIKGLLVEFGELFEVLRVPAYHVVIRPRGECPLLFLVSAQIDGVEWRVLTRSQPSIVIGSADVPSEEWDRFSRLHGVKVVRAADVSEVLPDVFHPALVRKEADPSWQEKLDSSL